MTLTRRNYGRGHAYTVDGEKAPGVTAIIGMRHNEAFVVHASKATASYAVDNWAELGQLPPSVRMDKLIGARWRGMSTAGLRGTKLHAYARRLHMDQEIRGTELDDEQAALVDSYISFLDRTDLSVVAAEMVIGNRNPLYCGTADLVADLPELDTGELVIPAARWLLDLKTALKGVFPDSALQTCAYSRAESYLRPNGSEADLVDLGIERCGAVHVRPDGWTLYPLDTGEETWETFTRLAWLYHHRDPYEHWVGQAIDATAVRLPAARF